MLSKTIHYNIVCSRMLATIINVTDIFDNVIPRRHLNVFGFGF